jgi:hypothetical protein
VAPTVWSGAFGCPACDGEGGAVLRAHLMHHSLLSSTLHIPPPAPDLRPFDPFTHPPTHPPA